MSDKGWTGIWLNGLPPVMVQEPYAVVRDRIEAARSIPISTAASDELQSPLGGPLVQVKALLSFEGSERATVWVAIATHAVVGIYEIPVGAFGDNGP